MQSCTPLRFVMVIALGTTFGSRDAQAVIVPTDPFVGSVSESFESFDNYLTAFNNTGSYYVPLNTSILSGTGTLSGVEPSDPTETYIAIYEPGVADVGGSATFDGSKGLATGGLLQHKTVFEFVAPVNSFGGYINTTSDDLDVHFYDGVGAALGSVVIPSSFEPGASLSWLGWTSSTPIGKIEFVGQNFEMDALQANPVPEPSGGLLGCLAMVALCRRRLSHVATKMFQVSQAQDAQSGRKTISATP